MLISTKGRYALRVLADIAEHQSDGFLPLKEVADRQEISEKYLESIVRTLVSSGILTGVRGKGGGYRLSKAPDQIGVKQVLDLMEGTLAPVACLETGAVKCPRMANCRTLELWRGLNRTITDYLEGYTVADLMDTAESGNDYVI